jgi:oxygen-independent coproporphyrinogen-3 oxidase
MSASRFQLDLDTIRRFDRPGPRYTSYPTAVEFHEGVGEELYRQKLEEADALASPLDDTGDPLSLYAHLPFCEHRCLFCGCHVVITPHMPVAEKYLEYLKREIDSVAARLPHRRRVSQMQWGGGTPTYFNPDQLVDLLARFREHFEFMDGAELAIEVDPRVTSREHLERLAGGGFNRLSMGVQDLTPEVQEAITRGQSYEETAELMEHARKVGFTEGINLDLVYGLPRQELESFDRNLDQVLDLRPDRVAVYSFAYVPWIKGHQKKLDQASFPTPELKLQLYLRAMERFLEAGYEPIGMDHFALPEDELAVAAGEGRLHRNFMGYSVMPASDMVAFGISGIGDIRGAFFQNEKKLSDYYQAVDEGRLPVARGYLLDEDDRIRQYVIQQIMCNFRVTVDEVRRRFGVSFHEYFRSSLLALDELEEEGFVEVSEAGLRVTEGGRLFVRNVCMAFDRYLQAQGNGKPVFSRTV